MEIDLLVFITPANELSTRKEKTYEHNTTGHAWPLDYRYCYCKAETNPITQRLGLILAQGEIGGISGKHMKNLLAADNDWISLNHDGIMGTPIGQPGMERRHILSNGDPRGMILAPRMLDVDAIVETREMPWQPYPDTYQFCYSQVWEAHEYAKDSECSKETRLPGNWMPAVKVRKAYQYDFAGDIGSRRVVEIWTGNDLLWEIAAFAENIGYIGYRQWAIQEGSVFHGESGRTIVWSKLGAPPAIINCCYGGPFIV